MTIRYIAKIVIEAETPLSVGSGQKGLLTDRLIAKDANNLPYIPGTSLCGVLRHTFSALDETLTEDLFGFGGDKGHGSRIKVSAAHLIGEDGINVVEGLKDLNFTKGYYSYFNRLPERDHVRMTHKGVADAAGHGKYDEELVHKGTRFAFEIELLGSASDKTDWERLLNLFGQPIFRIGAGTRKGFGKIKVVSESSFSKTFDLTNAADLTSYLNKTSSLNSSTENWTKLKLSDAVDLTNWTKYALEIKPKDFFLFSAGFGDEDADAVSKTEKFFEWSTGKPQLTAQKYWLIPATSLKGAIAHRVAFYYNKSQDVCINKPAKTGIKTDFDVEKAIETFDFGFNENMLNAPADDKIWQELAQHIKTLNYADSTLWKDFNNDLDAEVHKLTVTSSNDNKAVQTLFGYAKDSDVKNNASKSEGKRGCVIINDIYLPVQIEKVFNHTKIDRFTNGTIDGALFQEKAAHFVGSFTVEIWVENKALEDQSVKDALEKTLEDLTKGELQLGGNTTKGHGIFLGELLKTDKTA